MVQNSVMKPTIQISVWMENCEKNVNKTFLTFDIDHDVEAWMDYVIIRTLRENCPNTELFLVRIFLLQENPDQK